MGNFMKKKRLIILSVVGALLVIIGIVVGILIFYNKRKIENYIDVGKIEGSILTLNIPAKEVKAANTTMQLYDLYYESLSVVEWDLEDEGYLTEFMKWLKGLTVKKEVKREDVIKDLADDGVVKGYWIEPFIYIECNGKTYIYEADVNKSDVEESLEGEVWYEIFNPKDPLDEIEYVECNDEPLYAKPVIYLYPEEEMKVDVKLDVEGEFTYTYPKYQDVWSVIASADGTLKDVKTGDEYSYLFWESATNTEFNMSEGFVVKGSDSTEFLKDKLSYMGLTPREYNEFIVYWAPLLEQNEYNLIKFAGEEYENTAKLSISPQPDSVLRVFMVYEVLEEPVKVKEQKLKRIERNGFTVVEWGGRRYN